MGKHDKIFEFDDNARALTVSNIIIANELAEANRLKRFQLKNKHFLAFDKITVGEFRKELEDQA